MSSEQNHASCRSCIFFENLGKGFKYILLYTLRATLEVAGVVLSKYLVFLSFASSDALAFNRDRLPFWPNKKEDKVISRSGDHRIRIIP